jgi:hypothetical protein
MWRSTRTPRWILALMFALSTLVSMESLQHASASVNSGGHAIAGNILPPGPK